MEMLIFLTSKTSVLLLDLNKELKFIFSPNQVYDILKKCDLNKENYLAIVPHLFLSDW